MARVASKPHPQGEAQDPNVPTIQVELRMLLQAPQDLGGRGRGADTPSKRGSSWGPLENRINQDGACGRRPEVVLVEIE